MIKNYMLMMLMSFLGNILFAEPNVIPQNLLCYLNFKKLNCNSKAYPVNCQGCKISSSFKRGKVFVGFFEILLLLGTVDSVYSGICYFDGEIGLAGNYNNDNSVAVLSNITEAPSNNLLKISTVAMPMRNLYYGVSNDPTQSSSLLFGVDIFRIFTMINNSTTVNMPKTSEIGLKKCPLIFLKSSVISQ